MVKGLEQRLKRLAAQGDVDDGAPRKRFYRSRAHSNPLNDAHFPVPTSPADVDWTALFPAAAVAQPADAPAADGAAAASAGADACAADAAATGDGAADDGSAAAPAPDGLVRFVDVGCGFGGLLIRLAPLYADKLILGFELRDKVSEYVKERIAALRREQPGTYGNIACARTNAMKFLPNYFGKGQLEKLFFLFPDPHFKATNHRRRIIQTPLLAEYAYLLKEGGMLYTISDVQGLAEWMQAKLDAGLPTNIAKRVSPLMKTSTAPQELAEWMQAKLDTHPLFERISDEELEADPAAWLLAEGTEEGQKVARNSGQVWRAVYRRVAGALQ